MKQCGKFYYPQAPSPRTKAITLLELSDCWHYFPGYYGDKKGHKDVGSKSLPYTGYIGNCDCTHSQFTVVLFLYAMVPNFAPPQIDSKFFSLLLNSHDSCCVSLQYAPNFCPLISRSHATVYAQISY